MAEKRTSKSICLHLLVLVAIFVGAEANDTNATTVQNVTTDTAAVVTVTKNIDWTKGFSSSDARAIIIEAGTELIFGWESFHNVEILPTIEAFDACDFSSSVLVGDETGVKYAVNETTYFACSVPGHCLGGQKLEANVASLMVDADTMVTSDTNDEEEEPEGGWPGGCYDMDVHKCGCQSGYCNKAMCEGNGRLWADGGGGGRACPIFCDPEVCTDKASPTMNVPQAPSESPTIQRGGCFDGKDCSCGIDRCMQSDCEAIGFEWASIDQCKECAPVVCRAKRMQAASAAATASSFLMSTFVVVAAAVIATMV